MRPGKEGKKKMGPTARWALDEDRLDTFQDEVAALQDIFRSTHGTNWVRFDNWLTNKPLSEWYGVTCESGHVRHINLKCNNLSGPLPPKSFKRLRRLESISLEENKITGRIPTMRGMTVLFKVNLSQNEFAGPMPKSVYELPKVGLVNYSSRIGE